METSRVRTAAAVSAAFALSVAVTTATCAVARAAVQGGAPDRSAAQLWDPADDMALPLPGYGDEVPDDAGHVLLVSGGSTGNSVLVVGYRGTVLRSIDDEYGASGMVLSADGSTLYVALASGDAVSAINTTTWEETARYTTASHTCPTYLARTGADVWIGYGCGDAWNGGVGVLDTSAAQPQIVLDKQDRIHDALYSGAPRVAAADTKNALLVVSEPALSPVTLATYSVDGANLTLRASQPRGGSNLNDLAVAPDGSAVFTAAASRDGVDAYTPGDLSGAGSYHTAAMPAAIALSNDGSLLAVAATNASTHVLVYRIGDSVPEGGSWIRHPGAAEDHGLAFSGDGNLLFLVTSAPGGGSPHLTILSSEPGSDGDSR